MCGEKVDSGDGQGGECGARVDVSRQRARVMELTM